MLRICPGLKPFCRLRYNGWFISMGFVNFCAVRSVRVLILAGLLVTIGCSSSPTAPTPPPPPPPVADAPSISCVEGISRSTTSADGLSVNYDTPSTSNGQGSVTVSCSPPAGQMFPVGSTAVSCTATLRARSSSSPLAA